MPVLNRRSVLAGMFGALGLALWGRRRSAAEAGGSAAIEKLEIPRSEWKKRLSPEAYAVLFEEATERPNSSPLDQEKRPGTFLCAACMLPLFESSAKFDSGTGWPSFFQPIAGHVATKTDYKLVLPRTEYHCARCGGHQGHVFDDGPKPTGLRYCNNGVALRFVPQGEPLPPLVRS
jgi:peptide-methionine (R)-S-oxide reductase